MEGPSIDRREAYGKFHLGDQPCKIEHVLKAVEVSATYFVSQDFAYHSLNRPCGIRSVRLDCNAVIQSKVVIRG